MKHPILTVCLLVFLSGAARAESLPAPEPSKAPQGELEARRQLLEDRRKALEGEFQQLATELEERAQRMNPGGQLTSDQLFALLQAREQRLAEERFDPTPIVAITFFGSMMTAFLAWLIAGQRKARQLHETVRLMVEKGAEIPVGLLAPPPRRKPSDLRRGVILSASGLGLTIFLAAVPDMPGVWGAGVTLLLIGLGHLLVWRLQHGKGPLSSALSAELHP